MTDTTTTGIADAPDEAATAEARGNAIFVDLDCRLTGYFYARLTDRRGKPLGRRIKLGTPIYLDCHWWLEGDIAGCLCGFWCCVVHWESIGSAPELSLPPTKDELTRHDPCRDPQHYWARRRLPDVLSAEHCGPIYKVAATWQFLTPCKYDDAPDDATDPSQIYIPGDIVAYHKIGRYQVYRGKS